MNPRVFIIVLNWNRAQDTIECINSLNELNYQGFEVLVVDNASQDESVRIIKRTFQDLTLIENARNLGYAEGNNVGIRHAINRGADYVLVLNNDTVVDRDMLTRLVDAAQADEKSGIIGPKIYDFHEPNKIWFAGANINWSIGESHHIGLGEIDMGQFNRVIEVDRLTGCAMLIKREVFEKTGLFDPDYFLYFEDVDLCVRAAKDAYKNICVQTAKVWHKESSSTKANQGSNLHTYYHTRNRLLFLHKHFKINDDEHQSNHSFCREYIRHFIRHPFDRGYRKKNSARFWAIKDFYRGRFGEKAKYHTEISKLMASDHTRTSMKGI